MKIKNFLIGSAMAIVASYGAQAADTVVAAEPEPAEHVRVCDAFGAGFFYIPGTETCTRFSGFLRFYSVLARNITGTSDWDIFSQAQFNIDTRNDTELGVVRSFIEFRGDNRNVPNGPSHVNVEQAFIELGGLKIGKYYSWWDDGLAGETDNLNTNNQSMSIRYTYDAGAYWFGGSVDELESTGANFINVTSTAAAIPSVITYTTKPDNNVGITGGFGGKFGTVALQVIGSYDFDQEDGAIRALLFVDAGPGTIGLSGIWASGVNAYYGESEWVLGAEYSLKANDILTITPAVQYSWNVAATGTPSMLGITTGTGPGASPTLSDFSNYYITNDWTNNDELRAGLTFDYKVTDQLFVKVAATYIDRGGLEDQWVGLVRMHRSF